MVVRYTRFRGPRCPAGPRSRRYSVTKVCGFSPKALGEFRHLIQPLLLSTSLPKVSHLGCLGYPPCSEQCRLNLSSVIGPITDCDVSVALGTRDVKPR